MNLRTSRAVVAATLAAGALTASMLPATSATTDQAVPTYQQFRNSSFVDADSQYIVNGDEPISSDGGLRQFYDAMVKDKRTGKQLEEGLIVNTVSGRDDKWSASQALNLTYCVSTKFGSSQATVANAMQQGAALWEGASSKVNFTYLPANDSTCTTRNNAVLFSVEPTSTTQYIARAFFPSSSDRSRNILVNAASLVSSGSWEPGDILGHELGHTLGFRHEHTRPEAGTCFEDNNWRPLTPYDSKSIMHYPQCNGGSSDLEFQPSDAEGVRALYGA